MIKDFVKNFGISFSFSFIILSGAYKFGFYNYLTVFILFVFSFIGSTTLESIQCNRNYETQEEKDNYMNNQGWKDVLYRMIGVMTSILLSIFFLRS